MRAVKEDVEEAGGEKDEAAADFIDGGIAIVELEQLKLFCSGMQMSMQLIILV